MDIWKKMDMFVWTIMDLVCSRNGNRSVCLSLSLHKFIFKFSDSDASLDNVVLVRCMPGCCCFTQMHVWMMLFCSLNAAATSWGFVWICGSVLCFSLCGFAIRSCICERKSI